MKTITFYNKKGGVGKSSFAIMYASYLAYKHGLKVGFMDYDLRTEVFRGNEIRNLDKGSASVDENQLWKIVTVKDKNVRPYGEMQSNAYIEHFKDVVTNGPLAGMDVVIVDLPGTFANMHLQLFIGKLINLCVVPIDKDQQTLIASKQVIDLLIDPCKMNYCSFINQIQNFNKKEEYVNLKNVLKKYKMNVLPDMVSYSERIKKIENDELSNVMRSSLRYPNWENKEFEGSKDLGIENLFYDITLLLDKTTDLALPNTKIADLSFIKEMKKDDSVGSLNRQLVDTSFPELEMELPENMINNFVKNK